MRISDKPTVWRPLDASTRRARSLSSLPRLWFVQTSTHPDAPLAFVGNSTFLVKSADLADSDGRYAPVEAYHKYRNTLNTTLGIVIKCIDVRLPFKYGKPRILSANRVYMPGPMHLNIIDLIAQSTNVLWIDAYRPAKHHALASRRALLETNPLSPPFGYGGRQFITDTGLDLLHCMFYDNMSVPFGVLNLTGGLPSFHGAGKVLGVMPVEYAPGLFTNGSTYESAHGTMTAGVMAGYYCADNMGVSPGSQFLFMDITGPGETLNTPSDWTRSFTVAFQTNLSIHSASWGTEDGDGLYDDLAAQFDEFAIEFDLLHVISAGNDGPGLVSSPATLKNGLTVGAG